MSTITFRLDRDKDGWSNRSELTFHIQDWNLAYAEDRIDACPRPIDLFWRICTAVFFLGIAAWLASWLISSVWHDDRPGRDPSVSESVAPSSNLALAPWDSTEDLYKSRVSVAPRQAAPTADDLRRMTEELERHLSPAERELLEQRAQERIAERGRSQQAERQRRNRITKIWRWIGVPLVSLFILVIGWIGVSRGVLEVVRYPIDRISIVREGRQLTIRRPRLQRALVVTRPIDQLANICYRVRRIGRKYGMAPASLHWVATLYSRPESNLPRIEFFVSAQYRFRTLDPPVPHRVVEFLQHLQQLTGSQLRRV